MCSMRAIALLLLCTARAQSQGPGMPTCPCLTSYPPGVRVESDGRVAVTIEGEERLYPAGFGLNNCAAHSTTLPPYCADASGDPLPGRPDWCSRENRWCYVDHERCTDLSGNYMLSSLSSYFPGAHPSLFYSYGTCGGARNTFDAWVGSSTECTMEQALSLVATLEHYVNNTALTIERSWEAYNRGSVPQCTDHKSCPISLCDECQSVEGWNYPVDFSRANERCKSPQYRWHLGCILLKMSAMWC